MNKQDGDQDRREGNRRIPMRGCACGCDDTLSLTNGGLSRRKFMASAAGAATLAATGFGRATGPCQMGRSRFSDGGG